MGAAGSDKAIAAILKWSGREEWREPFEDIIAAHLGPACVMVGVEPEELPDLLGEGAYNQLIGCALEDFMTRDFEPDDRNIVDDYLKRRGWKESASAKRYLEALRCSTLSIYEVVDTVPGSHLVVRDLVRSGEPVVVKDRLGSTSAAKWDRLAARLLPLADGTHMAGGVLLLELDAADKIVEHLGELRKELQRTVRRQAEREGVRLETLAELPLGEVALGEAAPLITGAWLASTLERMKGGLPKLVNFDGESLVLCETRFPLADSARADEVAACLDRLPDVERDEPARSA